MDVETTQIAAACLGIGTVILCRRQKKRRERKIWVKPWISTRETDGAFHRLLKDLGLLNILLLKATKFSCFLWSFLLFLATFLRSCYKQRPPCL